MSQFPSKYPDEVLDYTVDWTNRLEPGVTILTRTIEVEGATLDSSVIFGKRIIFWLSGGTPNVPVTIYVTITTSYDQTMTERFSMSIKKR